MKNFIFNKKEKTEKKGFTLVETLVAIFVLTLSIMGPMAAAQSSLKASFVARDQITAFYLAQDSIESIKALRDSVYVNNVRNNETNDWLDLLSDCKPDNSDGANKYCKVINTNNPIELQSASAGSNFDVYLINNEFTNQIGDANQKTKYSRKVNLTRIGNKNDELKITVEIEWTGNFLSGTRKIVVQENIYNWFKF